MLKLDRSKGILSDLQGRCFDPEYRRWAGSGGGSGEIVSSIDAVGWLQHESGFPLTAPVSVVGPRRADRQQYTTAEALGAGLAKMGLVVACGGGTGVMEGVCRGVQANAGVVVGLLPGVNPEGANPYLSVTIATGIGEARNALIARAGFCILAVGNSYGTLSEVALGLQFGKPVFGLSGAARLEGVMHYNDSDSALLAVAHCVLSLTPQSLDQA